MDDEGIGEFWVVQGVGSSNLIGSWLRSWVKYGGI